MCQCTKLKWLDRWKFPNQWWKFPHFSKAFDNLFTDNTMIFLRNQWLVVLANFESIVFKSFLARSRVRSQFHNTVEIFVFHVHYISNYSYFLVVVLRSCKSCIEFWFPIVSSMFLISLEDMVVISCALLSIEHSFT